MTIKRRLLIFGTGLLIGTVLSYLLLGWRGCSDWLPERRLRADIEMEGLDRDARTTCLLVCLDDADPIAWLYAAEVDWQASGPRETPKRYVFRLTEGPVSSFTVTRNQARWMLSVDEAVPGCDCP